MDFGTEPTPLLSPECDLFQQNLKISSKGFENQLNKFSRIWIRPHLEKSRITSPHLQTTQRFWFRTWIINWFCGRKSGSNSPASQKYWAIALIHVWQAGVFTLLTTMPYSTEVLSHCLAVTSSIPGYSPPAHGLLPAIPVATCQVDFLARAGWHLLSGFFACSPATLTLLCTSSSDVYHCADETERPVLPGNVRPAGTYGKCHISLMQSGSHIWLDLIFPDMTG